LSRQPNQLHPIVAAKVDGYSPLIRWAGSKRALLPKLLGLTPPTMQRYVEPFAGSAALFLNLKPRRAILGDINKELLDALRVLRQRPDALHERLSTFQMSRDAYYELRSARATTS
jgi:DNA adenine methylase